jgi:branched-subunit amino acid aminotransferase/4-amino-4-deoxychorismate lyase
MTLSSDGPSRRLRISTLVGGSGQAQSSPTMRTSADVLKEHNIEVPADCPRRVIDELARMATMLWLNGEIVPRERFYIDPSDQGLLFGRGLWECTRTFGGVPWLWQLHIERLVGTAALLDIKVDPGQLPNAADVTAFVRALTAMDVVIRLNVTAGHSGKPGIVWMTAVLPPAPMRSIRLQSCRSPIPTGQPYQIWKTFQYGGRLRAADQARGAGFDNALLLDRDDHVLEAAHANIFVRLPDGWVTPAAQSDGLLPGTVRRHLLENANVPIREQIVPFSHLSEAREAFVTNSNVGLVPVVQIDEQVLPIGRETLEIARWLIRSAG